MLSKTAAASDASWLKSGAPRIGHRLGACLRTSLLAVACVAVAGPAFARSQFDGDWSVVINTRGGACEPSIRYGVTISDGAVLNSGGAPADVRGRVSRSGAVRVNVQAGNQWASGSGRLGRYTGGGVWRGQGSAGTCEGTWVAQRRTNAVEAEGPGRPIYNYAPGQAGYGYNYAPGQAGYGYRAAMPFAGQCPPGTYLSYTGAQYVCR
jgi:hypothetical protein